MDVDELTAKLLNFIRNDQNNPDITYQSTPKTLADQPETKIYTFQLANTSKTLQKQMVLRIYPEHTDNKRAKTEQILHNYLADHNYPTPRIHSTSTDSTILGDPFTVMDFIPGETLHNYGKDYARILAQTTAELHNIDPKPLQKRFKSEKIPENLYTGFHEREQHVQNYNLDWLNPAIKWLKENKPTSKPAVCHGDLHEHNILLDNDKVSGVIDWSHFCLDDPCRDVGSTLTLNKVVIPCYRSEEEGRKLRERMNDYLELYCGLRDLDLDKLEYYEALRCFGELTEVGRIEVQQRWGVFDAAANRFTEISSIPLTPKYP